MTFYGSSIFHKLCLFYDVNIERIPGGDLCVLGTISASVTIIVLRH